MRVLGAMRLQAVPKLWPGLVSQRGEQHCLRSGVELGLGKCLSGLASCQPKAGSVGGFEVTIS